MLITRCLRDIYRILRVWGLRCICLMAVTFLVLWGVVSPVQADPGTRRYPPQAAVPDPGPIMPPRLPTPAPTPCPLPERSPAFAAVDFAAEPPQEPTLREKVVQQVAALGKRAEQTHDSLERGILHQVLRLDDFFGKTDSVKEQRTAYLLRWRNSLREQQGAGLNFGSTLRANLVLSRINERLQLAISGAGKPDQFSPSLPEDPGNPGFDRTFRNTRIVNTELRYQWLRTADTDLFSGAGVDLALPPEFFARTRFLKLIRLGDFYLARVGETVFVKNPDGFGETTEFSIERSLDPKTLVRHASSATVSQEIKAVEWGTELSLLRVLTPKSGITVTGGVYGNTSVNDWVTNYRILATYRRNFLRPWLFYELEPQVTWPRQADGGFPINYALTVRLEVVFQGDERKLPLDR